MASVAPHLQTIPSAAFFVKVEMQTPAQAAGKKKTRALKASGGQCQWKETFHFPLSALDHACSLSVRLYSRGSVRRKQCLGQVGGETDPRLSSKRDTNGLRL